MRAKKSSSLREKSKTVDRSKLESKIFIRKQEGKSSYYIIQTTPIQYEGIPKYSIICKDEKNILNTLSILPVEMTRMLDSVDVYTIETYIKDFDERRYERKKTKKLVVQNDD